MKKKDSSLKQARGLTNMLKLNIVLPIFRSGLFNYHINVLIEL